VALFTTDWEFATKIDARSHPHKSALNIQQENGDLIYLTRSIQWCSRRNQFPRERKGAGRECVVAVVLPEKQAGQDRREYSYCGGRSGCAITGQLMIAWVGRRPPT
jgi:hypothetical protein